MATGRTAEQKKAAAIAITNVLVEHCNAHAEHVYVVFDDIPKDDWIVGGETITERMAKRGET
jgi:4-oxalocrotonate tautomerase